MADRRTKWWTERESITKWRHIKVVLLLVKELVSVL